MCGIIGKSAHMSGQVPNPETRSILAVPFRASLAVHPDYTYWSPHWETIRDCEIGEIEIKRKSEKYLPKLQSQDKSEYSTYLRRAVFFNMTSRTLNALYGTVFRRAPKVSGLNAKQREAAKSITKDGTSLHLMAKTTVKEVLAVGRYGLLVDASPDGVGNPYVACYTAENILDWEVEEINGKWQLSRVVLREIFYDRAEAWSPYQYKGRFRVLYLDEIAEGEYVYRQNVFVNDTGLFIPDIETTPFDQVTPEVRGEPLDYIPFTIIGPFTNHPDVEKPPMLDIVTLNISHYISYADLESARFLTGSPVYTVSLTNNEGAPEFYVGPNTVWQLGPNESASILEFAGHGLRFIENALSDKEAQISAIGGRMMPGTARGAAESDNSLAMKERNEQTLLLNISDTVDEGVTKILRWWADWNNARSTTIQGINFEVNRDFLMKDIGAREFRAIQQMYENGIIPVDVVYEYLRKAEVVPEWMDELEFTNRLNDAKQFPNMVDVLARMKNFPDAKSFHEFEMQRKAMLASNSVEPGAGDPDNPPVPQQVMAERQANSRNPKPEDEDEDENQA